MRTESVWAVIGGLVIGYIGWLVAYSIGDALTTVSVWSPIVLALSVLLAIWAALRAQRLRGEGNDTWAAFFFALPFPPAVLSLVVLGVTYV